ncbi:conserved hypothetical protein [Hyella patelloides LEGE 07179]|uniref:Uncharacterized protein n=1 Tax=Hyella patelloides LEGE 07179 TaxID=945734 RepID=A0A563VVX1_9CYAN|nr:hypothetical protein [Hyella patelloides]VEP15403.1 conserved hypothetical protein [Hyella patelloides LEGE 07179]
MKNNRFKFPWQSKLSQWELWFTSQLDALNNNEEIAPPWVIYPDTDPWWGGWRQGYSEAWLFQIWLPFWKRLDRQSQEIYAEKWDASLDWCKYIFEYWNKS